MSEFSLYSPIRLHGEHRGNFTNNNIIIIIIIFIIIAIFINIPPGIMLNYRPNGRRRLRRPWKRLIDEVETGLSKPNS
jgi:hypothetical protein